MVLKYAKPYSQDFGSCIAYLERGRRAIVPSKSTRRACGPVQPSLLKPVLPRASPLWSKVGLYLCGLIDVYMFSCETMRAVCFFIGDPKWWVSLQYRFQITHHLEVGHVRAVRVPSRYLHDPWHGYRVAPRHPRGPLGQASNHQDRWVSGNLPDPFTKP